MRVFGCILAMLMAFGVVNAQAAISDPLASGDAAEEAVVEKDTFGRDTPRSTMQGFLQALSDDNPDTIRQYLDDDFITDENLYITIASLKTALNQGGRLDSDLAISDKPEGDLADKLPSDKEKVGVVTLPSQKFDLLLTQKQDPKGISYWQFSKKTLEKINEADTVRTRKLAEVFGLDFAQGKTILGQDLVDLTSLVILIGGGLFATWIFVWVMYWFFALLYPRVSGREFKIPPKVVLPLTVVLLAYLLPELMVAASIPVAVRQTVMRAADVVAWVAMAWLVLRLIDAVFVRAENQSVKRNRLEQASILNLLRKIAKAVMLILAIIIIFGNLGFDLTTGIAALGVGGLALAFGAQKTIENLIGSVVIVADRPVHVGDYCSFGDMAGTVIDIGIRSTRIRTLNRTVVTVPNGEFSSMKIENYAARDMFHFVHNLYLKRSAKPAEMARMVKDLQHYLKEHHLVIEEWTQVRVSELRQDCFVVELRCYIDTKDVVDFFGKQSDLLLEILTLVEDYDVEHALPSQEIAFTHDAQTKDVLDAFTKDEPTTTQGK
ncbi:mechanosensitive ion channel family protein [Moraxella nasovis]|uniref:mechanosensitive ion channel family protein n=1 Tax=Moraxella nasovis TaxID=2904121 RepID=UPI001F6151B5|nr:mechanosensitive ion channel family protein [Moraxella nasovis]UNU73628.1 mechanosensitive ion channel family protein [Moraxella nasovis]